MKRPSLLAQFLDEFFSNFFKSAADLGLDALLLFLGILYGFLNGRQGFWGEGTPIIWATCWIAARHGLVSAYRLSKRASSAADDALPTYKHVLDSDGKPVAECTEQKRSSDLVRLYGFAFAVTLLAALLSWVVWRIGYSPEASLEFTHTALVKYLPENSPFVVGKPAIIQVVYENTKDGTAKEVFPNCAALIFSGSLLHGSALQTEETEKWGEFRRA